MSNLQPRPAGKDAADIRHSAEFALLLSCSRPKPIPRDRERQQALAGQVDTDTFIRLAIRHKLAPLAYCNLRQHGTDVFDPALLARLQALHTENRHKAMISLRTTRELSATGIRLCTLKGLDVALRAYGDLAARHVGDIDLLIDEASLETATAHLLGQGWSTPTPELLDGQIGALLRAFQPDCTFQRPGFPTLELHWRACANPHEFNIGRLGQYPSATTANGETKLDNEDLLIYLCLHGMKHGWQRLKWLYDIPNVVENLPLDWPRLWLRARQLGADKAVQQGLMLAEQLCALQIPQPARAGFRYRFSPRSRQQIQQFMQWPEAWIHNPPTRHLLKQYRYLLSSQTSPRILLWQATSLLHPNYLDVRQLKLPTRLVWLYLPLRPLLWASRQYHTGKPA